MTVALTELTLLDLVEDDKELLGVFESGFDFVPIDARLSRRGREDGGTSRMSGRVRDSEGHPRGADRRWITNVMLAQSDDF